MRRRSPSSRRRSSALRAGAWAAASRSARSTPARATAASSRSTRSTTCSTTWSASACASSPRRATPTCCSLPARSQRTCAKRWSAPIRPPRTRNGWWRSATARATAASSPEAPPAWEAFRRWCRSICISAAVRPRPPFCSRVCSRCSKASSRLDFMFRPNALKQRLRAGKRALGCWTVLGSPPVIELLAYCGFDYLLLDQEHGFGEPSALLHSLQAMAATPQCSSIVRVPSNDPNYLKRVLDAGVEGVMVPNVETADDARAVVAACRYPPLGRRGSALGSARASDYGIHSTKYKQAAADELPIVCQIESPKAVENIEAIAAVAGVDGLCIGPHDPSASVV